MKLRTAHTTRYLYREPVSMCHTEVHLTPRTRPNQTLLEHELVVRPTPDFSIGREDYFGNEVTCLSIEQPHQELTITARSVVLMSPGDAKHLELSPPWEQVREEARFGKPDSIEAPAAGTADAPAGAARATAAVHTSTPDSFEAGQFVFESPLISLGPAFAEYAAPSFPPGHPLLQGVSELSSRIYKDFRYDQRASTVSTPVTEVLAKRRGVCQDFAQLMIACLRSLDLPARYISGYLRSGEGMVGSDASHAWVSVWCPTFGWVDFDPTNDLIPDGEHVTVAWGRDYSDVTPVKGVALGGRDHVISVSVDVSPHRGS
jgi:transglutaminase-like putative cysteine protease